MRVLFIHGRSQEGKDPVKLKETWIETLEKGFAKHNRELPSDLEFDFPFYGDLLDEFTNGENIPSPDTVIKMGSGEHDDYEAFAKSVLLEIKENINISDEEIEAQLKPGEPREMGPQNWAWIRGLVKVIDKHLTPVSDFAIDKVLTDVFLYVERPGITDAINEIIEEKLSSEPTIVVGHSLGSIVGYNILKKHADTKNFVKYITLGSPLGIKAISAKLGVVQNPVPIQGWYNAYDNNDIVALNPLNHDYFPTDPAIHNYDGVVNQTNNQHGIIGYLNDKEIAGMILTVIDG